MKNIVFCGGDKRELPVMAALLEHGYKVYAYGCPKGLLPSGIISIDDVSGEFPMADICILPQTPVGKDGSIASLCSVPVRLDVRDLEKLRANTPVLCGAASVYLRQAAKQCRIIEMAENDDLAMKLAPASAEGAIAEAFKLTGGLLAGQRALVIGYGRIGREIAWRLKGLGVEVLIYNRGTKRAEEAADSGFAVADKSQFVSAVLYADVIFNTAPALLLDGNILGMMREDACIVDVAAAPGGTDFDAAVRRGIKAIHAGGLPGKYAPLYAGRVMAEYYPAFIDRLLKGGDS